MKTRLSHAVASAAHLRSASRFRWPAAGALALVCAFVMLPRPAAAQTTLGVDLSFNDALDRADTDSGAGLDIYFGPRLDLAILTLTTELSAGYHDFGGELEPTVYRGLAGGRLGLGFGIRPSVFAHLGVGHLRYDALGGPDRDGRTHFAGDLGLALDFTILPLIDLGVHGSYNLVSGAGDDEAFEWLQAGAHVIFVLGDT